MVPLPSTIVVPSPRLLSRHRFLAANNNYRYSSARRRLWHYQAHHYSLPPCPSGSSNIRLRWLSNTSLSSSSSSDCASSSSSSSKTSKTTLRIQQIPVKTLNDDNAAGRILYEYNYNDSNSSSEAPNGNGGITTITSTATPSWTIRSANGGSKDDTSTTTTTTSSTTSFNYLLQKIQRLFTTSDSVSLLLLPAQYPKSVASGYLGFVSFCFSASVAGSAAMVLSTQTLLLAVGIVGNSTAATGGGAVAAQAGIMAGALNWVMKDFVGQLGGVVFASQMGQTRAFDSDPKRWRMVSAMALDCATLLEILSPLVAVSLVLPIASVANIGKNIGFLTASASRAALHQSLAIAGNLGDVTAKAGSQAIMASLIGTSVGIGLSSLLQHDTLNFALGFLGLSIIHQGCNYLSLQFVPLAHFNTQRLSIVLEEYLATKTVLSPVEVSKRESFFPLSSSSDRLTKEWLQVGRPLQQACPNPRRLDTLLKGKPKESSYLVSLMNDNDGDDNENTTVDVIYFDNATGEDVICGFYHAWLIRRSLLLLEAAASSEEATTKSTTTTTESDCSNCNSNTAMDALLQSTYKQVETTFPNLIQELQHQGWKTALEVTTIESSSSVRINTYDDV